jgi:alpha-glucosidase (family GH31 glycosyl hydrolase)
MELAGSDGPLYTSEEAFIDRRGRRDSGFFLDSTARSAFDPRGGSRLAAMCAKLREMGIRLVTIVDPGVKRDACYPLYVEGCRTGHFCGKRRGNKAVSRRRGEEPQARIV